MNKEIETFINLKYKIITSDQKTWHFCETYPIDVLKCWFWKCVLTKENNIKDYPQAEKLIDISKKYKENKILKSVLINSFNDLLYSNEDRRNVKFYDYAKAFALAQSFYYAAIYEGKNITENINNIILPVVQSNVFNNKDIRNNWTECIICLEEELSKYEKNKYTFKGKHLCTVESNSYLLSRSQERIKEYGEVFTPTKLVLEILDELPIEVWKDGKTYLDPTCGNGQFLSAVLIIKQSLNHINPLNTIYGVDIMQDNVNETRQRLINIAGDTEENWKIVKNNILCKDGLTYDYSFDVEPTPSEQLFEW